MSKYTHSIHRKRGAALLLFIIFFTMASAAMAFLLSQNLYLDASSWRALITAKQAQVTSDGAVEEVVQRIIAGGTVSGEEILSALPGAASTTITYDNVSDRYEVTAQTQLGDQYRTVVVELAAGPGSAFNYGMQTGNGGFRIANSASVIGNTYSNGVIEGQGASLVDGDVISAGSDGLIKDITTTGSTWSDILENSTIDGDASYNTEVGSNSVGGTRTTPFSVLPEQPLPISETEIDEWQDHITDTGTVISAGECSGGTYTISSDTVLGNVRIECDLEIRGSGSGTEVTLTGPVWVEGNISLTQGPILRTSSFLGSRSVQIIADNPSNRDTSSQIEIRNSTEFYGNGSGSYIMLLSRNNSVANGGSEPAITIGQSSSGELILYTNEGLVDIGNQIGLRSVTGYRIDIGNNSTVTYESGLANTRFTGGPGGAYVIADWYLR